MLKSGPNYKMSKQAKRFLATIVDDHKRGEARRMLVQAELASLIQVKTKGKRETTE